MRNKSRDFVNANTGVLQHSVSLIDFYPGTIKPQTEAIGLC